MSFFKDKMTTWQKSKASKSRTQIISIKHRHKSEKLVPKHIKMNYDLNKQPDLKTPNFSIFSFAEYRTAL